MASGSVALFSFTLSFGDNYLRNRMLRVGVGVRGALRGGEYLSEECVEHVCFCKGILDERLTLFQV